MANPNHFVGVDGVHFQVKDIHIGYVAEQICAGYVLGMPTDTFYGLAAEQKIRLG